MRQDGTGWDGMGQDRIGPEWDEMEQDGMGRDEGQETKWDEGGATEGEDNEGYLV